MNYQGQTALVTGASSGIGEAFAEQLAAGGATLIITARSEDKLEALAQRLRNTHGVEVAVVVADLATQTGTRTVVKALTSTAGGIDILINNAGFGNFGSFDQVPAKQLRGELNVNMIALAELCYAAVSEMLKKGGGQIVNVASTASFQAIPYLSNYAATKAYVRALSEGLNAEYAAANIKVLALCPGPVATGFQERAQLSHMNNMLEKIGMMQPEPVAAAALKAVAEGKSKIVPGIGNLVGTLVGPYAPTKVTAKLLAKALPAAQ